MNLRGKKILIVSPHPDDEAICCGGLIMLARRKGAKVFVLYMATGTSRQFMNGMTLEVQRIKEAKRAAKYGKFGYKIAFHGISTKVDGVIQKVLIEMIEDTVKNFKPNIVVIPYRNSYSQDHRAVAQACISALRPIPQSLHHQPEMILELEEATNWPTPANINFYVDISKVMDKKIELYKCHASQVTQDPQYRSCENLRRLAGFRGSEIGVEYAEGYNLIKAALW